MIAISHALKIALLHFVWQGAVAAAFLWAALFVLRNRSAKARYLVSCAILATLASAPVVTAWLAYAQPAPAGAFSDLGNVTGAMLTGSIARLDWFAMERTWALPLWACGVLLCSLRLLWGCGEVTVLRRSGEPAEDGLTTMVDRLASRIGIERPVLVMLSALADGPSVVGWLRPVILLPMGTLFGLTPEQLEAVLAHELAHIRRHDYLVNIAQMLVETLFFYHPAVWWISRRIRMERELCCDDIAVESCGDAVSYARALTTLERIRLRPSFAVGAHDGPLVYRVQRLLGVAPRECGPSRASAAIAIIIALAGFGLNAKFARGQNAPTSDVRDQPGITVDVHGSPVLHREPVTYPEEVKGGGVQGDVTVEVTLDAKGNVSDAHVLSGPQEFRKTVLQSVLTWHFAPDAAGSTRQVNIDFQKPPSDGPGAAVPLIGQVSEEQINERRKMLLLLADSQARASATYQTVQFMEDELERARRDLSSGLENGENLAPLRAKLTDAQWKLDRARSAMEMELTTAASRTVSAIEVRGASDEVAQLVRSRLPVHQGDPLTADLWEAVDQAVKQIDEHLQTSISPQADGSCILRIVMVGGAQ